MCSYFVDSIGIASAVASADISSESSNDTSNATSNARATFESSVSLASLAPTIRRGIAMRACLTVRARRDALVVVMRSANSLPSLAAARVVAGLRARGDAVRLVELPAHDFAQMITHGVSREAAFARYSSSQSPTCVLAIDAENNMHALHMDSDTDLARLGHQLVPDFTDFTFAQTRWLPIAASDVEGGLRPLAAVLHEVREYARRYSLPNLIFADDALNNEANTFAALVESIQDHATGVQWMSAVRVGVSDADGLSRRIIRRAALAGVRGITLRTTDERSAARATDLEKYAREAGIPTTRVDEVGVADRVAEAICSAPSPQSLKSKIRARGIVPTRAARPTDCVPLKD